jgi:hypothetical protein
MIIYINKYKVEVFTGARVKDAVLAYSRKSYTMMLKEKLLAFDRFGNQTDADGPLIEGQKLTLKRNIQ